jgi:hypothetical protein
VGAEQGNVALGNPDLVAHRSPHRLDQRAREKKKKKKIASNQSQPMLFVFQDQGAREKRITHTLDATTAKGAGHGQTERWADVDFRCPGLQ